MIKIFNHNHPSVYLNLLVLSLLGHIAVLFAQGEEISISIGIINIFVDALSQIPIGLYLVVSVSTFLNSILFNTLLVEKDNSARNSHLPAALFIILSALISTHGFFLPNQLMLSLVLSSIFFLQKLERDKDEVSSSFFIGFFISLASMFNPGVVAILFLNLFKVIDYKWSIARFFFLQLLGFIVPFYLVWTLHFLFDKGRYFVGNYFTSFQIELISFQFELAQKLLFIVILFFGFIALLAVIKSDNWKNVQPRAWIKFWVLLGASFLLISLVVPVQNQSLILTILPLAGFLPFSLTGFKRKILRSLILYVLLAILALDQLHAIGYLSF